jgi:hypothetical protein
VVEVTPLGIGSQKSLLSVAPFVELVVGWEYEQRVRLIETNDMTRIRVHNFFKKQATK